MKVYPVPNRCVRDPVTNIPVEETGLDVGDFSPFWLRRLRDGDVSKLTPEQQAQARKDVETKAEAAEEEAQQQLDAAHKAEQDAEAAS